MDLTSYIWFVICIIAGSFIGHMLYDIYEAHKTHKGYKKGKVSKFDVVRAITDEQKFSDLIFDIIVEYDSPIAFAKFLSEEFPEDGLQKLESIAQSDYPLSFDRKQ